MCHSELQASARAVRDALDQALHSLGDPGRVRLVDLYRRLHTKRDRWSIPQIQQGLVSKGYDVKRESWPSGRPGAVVAVRRRRPSPRSA